MSTNDVPKDRHLEGIEKPQWTCPNCKTEKFDSQRLMIQHALPCKQGGSND